MKGLNVVLKYLCMPTPKYERSSMNPLYLLYVWQNFEEYFVVACFYKGYECLLVFLIVKHNTSCRGNHIYCIVDAIDFTCETNLQKMLITSESCC